MTDFNNLITAQFHFNPHLGTLILIDFGIYKLLEVQLDLNQEIVLEVASNTGQIIKFSIHSPISILKDRIENYDEMLFVWNSNSSIKAI